MGLEADVSVVHVDDLLADAQAEMNGGLLLSKIELLREIGVVLR